MLLCVGTHSALHWSCRPKLCLLCLLKSSCHKNNTMSYTLCPGKVMSSKTAHLADGCPSDYHYNLGSQMPGSSPLCILHIKYIHSLPRCFTLWLSSFKAQLHTWCVHTHTFSLSPVCLLTLYLTQLLLLGAVL